MQNAYPVLLLCRAQVDKHGMFRIERIEAHCTFTHFSVIGMENQTDRVISVFIEPCLQNKVLFVVVVMNCPSHAEVAITLSQAGVLNFNVLNPIYPRTRR
jgi:competence transcription factor ComK